VLIPVCVLVEKITVDTFEYRLLLLTSLHYFVQSDALFVTVFGSIMRHCLDQKDLVLENLWSLGLGLETKVLVL